MLWRHPDHPQRGLRLAYCQNLHPSESLEEVLGALRTVTLPLRARVADGLDFGVGLYLPHALARRLDGESGVLELASLAGFLREHGLDPFTLNAFPIGGFHVDGLKERVFHPTWKDGARVAFTLCVARIAAALAGRTRDSKRAEHVSISTHTGAFGAHWNAARDLETCARNLALVVNELASIEDEQGLRVVLALEPEPRANAADQRANAALLEHCRRQGARALVDRRLHAESRALELTARHLGACLDTCHAAVEFEDDPAGALAEEVVGKVQYSSALVLRDPARSPAGRAELLGLAEPRYLHQVTGRGPGGFERADDLPDLAAALALDPTRWLACDEWRCHFHVPVDRERIGAHLHTTQASSRAILERLLADPARWSTPELHLEIETYTWDVLPASVRGAGELVDGLEHEYRHVFAILRRAGFAPE